jgi:hypothetical protein
MNEMAKSQRNVWKETADDSSSNKWMLADSGYVNELRVTATTSSQEGEISFWSRQWSDL